MTASLFLGKSVQHQNQYMLKKKQRISKKKSMVAA
jgi:hypothetical protein